MARTPTLPPTEPAMWKKLLAKVHPDAGGDHELFVWTKHLQEKVCGRPPATSPRPSTPREEPPRVPFEEAFEKAQSFEDLTNQAVKRAESVEAPYDRLLRLLKDCDEVADGSQYTMQHQGSTYRTLAAIGHLAKMDAAQRSRWYKVAESVPLSQRHAGHILSKLKEGR